MVTGTETSFLDFAGDYALLYTIIVIDGLSLLVIIVDVIMINNDYGIHIDDDNL